MKKIIIGKPYIKTDEAFSRLCADITWTDGSTRTLYYEVPSEFGCYLNDDRSDAFLTGLINSCMYNGEDIEICGVVSESLLFQLTTYYIPLISDLMSDMHAIDISAQTTVMPVAHANGVGTGNSGGVDSTYTMLKYSRDELKSFKLTHVLFTNISTNDTDDERIRALFERDIPLKKEAAENLGLTFISVYSNLYSFFRHPGIFNHYFAQQYCSAPMALGKLFRVYYFSSTFKANDYCMDEKKIVSSGRYDIFSLDTVSTPSLKFYSAGTEVDRMDKIYYINPFDYTKKYLQVCSIEQSAGGKQHAEKMNCGHCNKCGRMIGIYYALGILDDFKDLYDLSYFYQNKAKYIGKNLESDQGAFAKKVAKLLKEKKKYPFGTDFWRVLYRIRYKMAKKKKMVKLFHRMKRGLKHV